MELQLNEAVMASPAVNDDWLSVVSVVCQHPEQSPQSSGM
jgi:hypothetical protein